MCMCPAGLVWSGAWWHVQVAAVAQALLDGEVAQAAPRSTPAEQQGQGQQQQAAAEEGNASAPAAQAAHVHVYGAATVGVAQSARASSAMQGDIADAGAEEGAAAAPDARQPVDGGPAGDSVEGVARQEGACSQVHAHAPPHAHAHAHAPPPPPPPAAPSDEQRPAAAGRQSSVDDPARPPLRFKLKVPLPS